jgi:hypothetical protein
MMLGNSSKKAFGEEWRGFKFMPADGKRKDGDIYVARAEAFKEDGSDVLNDGKLCLGKFTGEGGELCGQEVRRNGGDGAKAKGAATSVFELGDVAASGFDFAKDRAGTRQKYFPEFRETNGTPETVEEAGAEFVFEFVNLLREGGLRDMGLLSAAAEAGGIGDSAEVAELVKFHSARSGSQMSVVGDRKTVHLGIGNAYLLYLN